MLLPCSNFFLYKTTHRPQFWLLHIRFETCFMEPLEAHQGRLAEMFSNGAGVGWGDILTTITDFPLWHVATRSVEPPEQTKKALWNTAPRSYVNLCTLKRSPESSGRDCMFLANLQGFPSYFRKALQKTETKMQIRLPNSVYGCLISPH